MRLLKKPESGCAEDFCILCSQLLKMTLVIT